MALDAGVGAALSVKKEHVSELLSRRNVVACGVGFKEREGRITDEPCVVVSVTKKLPKAQLTAEDIVPQKLGEVKTDVVEIGVVRALQGHQDKWRPAPGGVSVGHVAITAGTIGCLVHRGDEIFILSNNHVLANCNKAQIGDAIIQPGRYDGARPMTKSLPCSSSCLLTSASSRPSVRGPRAPSPCSTPWPRPPGRITE